MKAVKKKARDEETAVCVVEWRYPVERKKESKWLVVKRPEKGEPLVVFPSTRRACFLYRCSRFLRFRRTDPI
jgi:hypothetical protein